LSKKLTIEEMQKIAKERGGVCLSNQYVNTATKLRWRCKEGHIWEATPDPIKRGHWCPKCATITKANARRSNIQEIQDLAKSRDGVCLSTEYINYNTKLKWQCKEGHVWEATSSHIKSGSWCPYCAGMVKSTIEKMQKLAESKGGR
jgi:thiol-disulfide isomerase/thioredoxin